MGDMAEYEEGKMEDAFLIESAEKEQEWRDGFHTNKNGERFKLSDMPKTYLHNTIGLFKKRGYNVSMLEAEFKKRV